tara:strand:+ start:107 stop:358 length:252 start_codon:yes stop_codon:yes gene_type:complete
MVKKLTYPYGLIGEKITIVKAANQSNESITGIVVDETKSTIKVEQEGKIKTLLKKNITFKIEKTGQVIDGKTIAKKPEDRLKG